MSPIINKVLRWVYWTHVFVSFCMVCPWWFFYFWKLYSFSSFWSQSSFLAMCLIPAALFLLFRCLALFPALTTFSMSFLDIITRINIVVPGSFVAIWAVTCLYVHLGCDFLLTALSAMCGCVGHFFLAFANAARLISACSCLICVYFVCLGSCTTLLFTFGAVGLFSPRFADADPWWVLLLHLDALPRLRWLFLPTMLVFCCILTSWTIHYTWVLTSSFGSTDRITRLFWPPHHEAQFCCSC